MNPYVSNQARLLYDLGSKIISTINKNLNNFTETNFQDIKYGLLDAIYQIEAMLRHDNVRVRHHPRLGVPILAQDPKIRKMLKRFRNTVDVLCILTDSINDEQGSEEEAQCIVDANHILDLLLDNLEEVFSEPSSGAESE